MVSGVAQGTPRPADDASAMVGGGDEEHARPRDRVDAKIAVPAPGRDRSRFYGALSIAGTRRSAYWRRGDAAGDFSRRPHLPPPDFSPILPSYYPGRVHSPAYSAGSYRRDGVCWKNR